MRYQNWGECNQVDVTIIPQIIWLGHVDHSFITECFSERSADSLNVQRSPKSSKWTFNQDFCFFNCDVDTFEMWYHESIP